ncbi:MAG: 50S ribosomal protein L6 [Bacilli bacterium]|nr:50S ribosomal protein L6 [Bacilli bacterium]
MSRIGNRVIKVPTSVTVENNSNIVTVKGPKGELSYEVNNNLKVNILEGSVTVERLNEDKQTKAMHGTTNAIITNMIEGVNSGFSKGLEIIGVGYRFTLKGNKLVVNAGYSHPVEVEIPKEIEVESVSNTEIVVKGIDKELVGEFAANIRKIRKPEPYKGKGIRYKGEYIRRKEGKKASK